MGVLELERGAPPRRPPASSYLPGLILRPLKIPDLENSREIFSYGPSELTQVLACGKIEV